jgi:16S rRNA (uracil1498-N3)-methyltransferase
MARRRFFVEAVRNERAEVSGDTAEHLRRVLRVEAGQRFEIADNQSVYLAEVAGFQKDRVLFHVLERLEAEAPPVRVILLAALIKFDRFEWIVEKATELGAEAIVPVEAERSEKGLAKAAAKRVERWRRIALESSQQSRRSRLPAIESSVSFQRAIETARQAATKPVERAVMLATPAVLPASAGETAGMAGLATCSTGGGVACRYFLDEERGVPPLASVLPAAEERAPSDLVCLLVGPEGGWTGGERSAAVAQGWTPVTLGPQILRAETAALAALAVIVSAWITGPRPE